MSAPIHTTKAADVPSDGDSEIYKQAKAALSEAHAACYAHPERPLMGMSSGPFSGVNVALGLLRQLEDERARLVGVIVNLHAVSQARIGDSTETFQKRVDPWGLACFGGVIWNDELERMDRATEEYFEALQTRDFPEERIDALRKYVFSRPKGKIKQEIGGVMVTLAAWCLAMGIDMHECGETELARIWTKVDAIRAKQAAKPTGSALPIAVDSADSDMVKTAGSMPSAERNWLIKKGAHYYRANRSGYTMEISAAGRYTKEEAEREARIEPWHMQAVEVPAAASVRRTSDGQAIETPWPSDTPQAWETLRNISHFEAHQSAGRLINSHFRNDDRARVSIPANPDHDDDLIIMSYIRQQARSALAKSSSKESEE